MTENEKKEQDVRTTELLALREKVGIAIQTAETAEQQAERVLRNFGEAKEGLERAMNIF